MVKYPYPTSINWSEGLTDGFKYLNTVSDSWFSNMLLIAIYIIFSTGFYFARRDMGGALAVGGFALFVIGTLFWVGNLISGVTFAIVIGVAIISFASLWIGKQE